MLTTLLESRPKKENDRRGAVASVALHAIFIFAAVYATASGAPPKDKPFNPPRIVYVAPQPQSATNTLVARVRRSKPPSVAIPNPVVVPIAVPTSLPPVALPESPVTPGEFPRDTAGRTNASDQMPTGGPSRRPGDAYERSEVEVAVAVIGNVVPEYPSALRAANIQGKVFAEFVVNDLGRAEVGSLRILSPANEGFVEAIRRALPGMRFRPATIDGHPVAQLVQQQFVFKLYR